MDYLNIANILLSEKEPFYSLGTHTNYCIGGRAITEHTNTSMLQFKMKLSRPLVYNANYALKHSKLASLKSKQYH